MTRRTAALAGSATTSRGQTLRPRVVGRFCDIAAVVLVACRPAARAEVRAPAPDARDVAVVIESSTGRAGPVALSSAGPIMLVQGAPPLRVGGRTFDAAGDAVILALDWNGALRWAHQLRSDAHVIIDGLVSLPDGSVLFTGAFERSLVLAERETVAIGSRDCFVARVDEHGAAVSLTGLGGTQETCCRSIAVDGDEAWFAGFFNGALALGGREHASKGLIDGFVAHTTLSRGAIDGGFTIGTPGEEVARDVLLVGDDLLLVGGYGSPWGPNGDIGIAIANRALVLSASVKLESVGDADGFIARFDRSGQPRWALRQAGPGFDVVKQVAPLGDGFAATVFSQQGAPPPGVSGMASDVPLGGWVVHFDADGVERWRWTDPAIVSPSAIVTTDRGVAFSGHYRDGLVAGDERWPARGTTDAMWIELDASGRFVRGDHCGSAGADFSDAIAIDREQRIWFGGGSDADSTCTGDAAGGFLRRAAAP